MAMTDNELADLKKRCIEAMGTGATLARGPELMLELIVELEKHRKAACCPDEAPKATTKPAPAAKPEAPAATAKASASAPEASFEKADEKGEEKKGRGAGKKADKGD